MGLETDEQRRWWFAHLGRSGMRPPNKMGDGDRKAYQSGLMESRITPSEPSASQRQHIHSLIARKEAELKSGLLAGDKARVSVRSHNYRDEAGFLVAGRDGYGRSVNIFVRKRATADRIVAGIKVGLQTTLADFEGDR